MASQLVAHRGLPYRFPENSLWGFQAAIAAGAIWLETDIQLTADGVPILYHDGTGQRLSGLSGAICDMHLSDLQRCGVSYPQRFGARFRGYPVATLRQLCQLLTDWPQVHVFLELKAESMLRYTADDFVDRVLQVLAGFPLRDRTVFISFEESALEAARRRGNFPLGLVTSQVHSGLPRTLHRLGAAWVFVEAKCWNAEVVHGLAGPWQTAAYTANTLHECHQLARLGIDLLETDRFDELLLLL